MKFFIFHFSTLFIISILSIHTFAIEVPTEEFSVCVYKSASGLISRSLYVHKFQDELACMTVYRKGKVDQVVASGKWFGFCQKVRKDIEKNLENKFWTCKQLEDVNVFYSSKKLSKYSPSFKNSF